jgi:hypothetical protein
MHGPYNIKFISWVWCQRPEHLRFTAKKNCDKQTVLLHQGLTIRRRDRYANNLNLRSELTLVIQLRHQLTSSAGKKNQTAGTNNITGRMDPRLAGAKSIETPLLLKKPPFLMGLRNIKTFRSVCCLRYHGFVTAYGVVSHNKAILISNSLSTSNVTLLLPVTVRWLKQIQMSVRATGLGAMSYTYCMLLFRSLSRYFSVNVGQAFIGTRFSL